MAVPATYDIIVDMPQTHRHLFPIYALTSLVFFFYYTNNNMLLRARNKDGTFIAL